MVGGISVAVGSTGVGEIVGGAGVLVGGGCVAVEVLVFVGNGVFVGTGVGGGVFAGEATEIVCAVAVGSAGAALGSSEPQPVSNRVMSKITRTDAMR
jgi:hypothetical protein